MICRKTSFWAGLAGLAGLLFFASTADAAILGNQSLEIDFTKPDDAREKATWSDPDHLTCTTRGFGLEAANNACRDGWLQTMPVGVGTTWRPTQSASLRVTLKPARRKVELPNGQTYVPAVPSLYARHSPDAVHWSDWQPLTYNPDPAVSKGVVVYQGQLGTPSRNREAYDKYRQEYRKLEVPWVDDEEALCAWILKRDPEFFATNRPFVGYVQFLIEDCFPGGQRIEAFSATMSWVVNGLHQSPKDPHAERRHSDMKGWRFKEDAAASKQGNLPLDFEFHRHVAASDTKVQIVPAATVARTKKGLALKLKITNASREEFKTTLAQEWHGGEWPLTALYATVTGAADNGTQPFVPVYLIGENSEAARSITLAAGKAKEVELRMDWHGTGSVKGVPLIRVPGEYLVRFALVFEVSGTEQYVVTLPQSVKLPAE